MENSNMSDFKKFFEAGPIEAGLEVGADAGLSVKDYIKVPSQCCKKLTYTLSAETLDGITQSGAEMYEIQCDVRTSFVASDQPGWNDFVLDMQKMVHFCGRIWVVDAQKDGFISPLTDASSPVESISSEPWSHQDYKAFVAANRSAAENVTDSARGFFHACRLLSVLFGVGLSDHDVEWATTDDPTQAEIDSITDEEIAEITRSLKWAPTALCVRAAMFRKTKHATGGSIAQGFASKLVSQMAWPFNDDSQKRRSTTDLYLSTHAASPIGILAMIAPRDYGHFCVLNPICGIRGLIKSLSSVSLRVLAPDQISGAAMISDSFVVLKMLRSEGLLPLVKNIDALVSFGRDYAILKASGFRAHNAYGYYARRHPCKRLGMVVNFNQRNPGHWPLVCELATIARTFYKFRTIAKSPSLLTAANSSEDSGIDSVWRSLASMKSAAPPSLIVSYYNAMKGTNVGVNLQKMVREDITENEFEEIKEDLEVTINRGLDAFGDSDLKFDLKLLRRGALLSEWAKYRDGIPEGDSD